PALTASTSPRIASAFRAWWIDAVSRLFQLQAIHQALKALAILGEVDAVNAGPNDGSAGRFQCLRQIERRLPTELHDQSFRLHAIADIEHVLGGQRFEE